MEIVHPVPVDEVEPWLAALATTLLGTPWDDDFPLRVDRWRRDWCRTSAPGACATRALGRDAGHRAAPAHRPGGGRRHHDVAADALTAVTVAATHRRRGLLRQMLTASLQRGEGPRRARVDPDRGRVADLRPVRLRTGDLVRRLHLLTRARRRAIAAGRRRHGAPGRAGRARRESRAAIFDRARALRPGRSTAPARGGRDGSGSTASSRSPCSRATLDRARGRRRPGRLLAWKPDRDFDSTATLGAIEVQEFVAATPTAYRNLWAYLSGIDVVERGRRCADRPVDEPVRWLLADGRALRQTYRRRRPVGAAARRARRADGARLRRAGPARPRGRRRRRRRVRRRPVPARRRPRRRALHADDRSAPTSAVPARARLGLPRRPSAARSSRSRGGVDEHTAGALGRFDAMFATPLRAVERAPASEARRVRRRGGGWRRGGPAGACTSSIAFDSGGTARHRRSRRRRPCPRARRPSPGRRRTRAGSPPRAAPPPAAASSRTSPRCRVGAPGAVAVGAGLVQPGRRVARPRRRPAATALRAPC